MYAQSANRKAFVSFVLVTALAGALLADLPTPVTVSGSPAGGGAGPVADMPVTVLPGIVVTAPRQKA